MKPNDL